MKLADTATTLCEYDGTPQARRPWYCVPEHCPTQECAEFAGIDDPKKCKAQVESEG